MHRNSVPLYIQNSVCLVYPETGSSLSSVVFSCHVHCLAFFWGSGPVRMDASGWVGRSVFPGPIFKNTKNHKSGPLPPTPLPSHALPTHPSLAFVCPSPLARSPLARSPSLSKSVAICSNHLSSFLLEMRKAIEIVHRWLRVLDRSENLYLLVRYHWLLARVTYGDQRQLKLALYGESDSGEDLDLVD